MQEINVVASPIMIVGQLENLYLKWPWKSLHLLVDKFYETFDYSSIHGNVEQMQVD